MVQNPPSPRIPPLEPPYPPELEAVLDRVSPNWRDQPPLKIFRVWAKHPRLGQALSGVGGFLLQNGDVDPYDRELLILRTCALAGAEYEWGVHAMGYARRAGLPQETIEATFLAPTDDPAWSDRERLLLQLVDEFEASVDVSDELWAKLEKAWTVPQLLELLLIAGFYRFVSLTVRATRTELEEWAARFPEHEPS